MLSSLLFHEFIFLFLGNDEQVLVHNIETKQLLNVFLREDAVYSISTHPLDPFIFVTASEDGRLRLTDTRLIDTSCFSFVKLFFNVFFFGIFLAFPKIQTLIGLSLLLC